MNINQIIERKKIFELDNLILFHIWRAAPEHFFKKLLNPARSAGKIFLGYYVQNVKFHNNFYWVPKYYVVLHGGERGLGENFFCITHDYRGGRGVRKSGFSYYVI